MLKSSMISYLFGLNLVYPC